MIKRYEETRKRVTKFCNNRNMSDKEIIEFLYDEIEQYRERIRQHQELKDINTERNVFHCGIDGGMGNDFTVTRWYEDGVLIKEEIKPCQDIEKEYVSTCPPIEV